LDAQLAIIDKRRSGPNEIAGMNVVGEVEGQTTILVDDMVDTGGTLVKAANALLENGAKKVICCCSHAVLSGDAVERLQGSSIEKIIVSNSIYKPDLEKFDKFVQLSVAELLGEAIKRIHDEDSVSCLFGD